MQLINPRVAVALDTLTPLQSLIARRWRPQWVCHHCKQDRMQRRGLATSKDSSKNDNDKPYYITTPIFYVNAEPHVGHMYSMILADVMKRWQELKGRKAILCTGTDEHGLKVQQAAAKAGMDPKPFCDKGAEVFKQLAAQVNLSEHTFIRTTDQYHREAVEYAWQMLNDRDYIYESKHEGWYSVSDETFYPESQIQRIVDPPTGRKIMVSIETGKEVEWSSERNYHFRLSAFRDRLLNFYQDNPKFIVPESKMKEVVRQVESGLEDLSVSRPVDRLTWGIRVPNDPSQTMYVWLDALLNYASAVGYPFTPGSETSKGWPADVHVIGKDIVRFHCIYWPAFLMALDLPPPKQVLAHAHWTLGKLKMAKSTGNVVNPFFALGRFGTDAMRYFLMHNGSITDDSVYDNALIVGRYKNHLQGGLGNLLTRITRGRKWNVREAVEQMTFGTAESWLQKLNSEGHQAPSEEGSSIARILHALPDNIDDLMASLSPNHAVQSLLETISSANKYITQVEPWKLADILSKLNRGGDVAELAEQHPGCPMNAADLGYRINQSVFLASETLRLVGIMLQPCMPETAGRILDTLGVPPENRTWEFCRLGADGTYGTPLVELKPGVDSTPFPRLASED